MNEELKRELEWYLSRIRVNESMVGEEHTLDRDFRIHSKLMADELIDWQKVFQTIQNLNKKNLHQI